MKETDKLEDGGMKIEEALAVAIVKYKKAIQMKMSTCDIASGQEEGELWATIFADKDKNSWCKWNTGQKCNCKHCPNESMLQIIAWFTYIFHFMGKDRLVQTIVEDVENRGDDICLQAYQAIKEYRVDIMEEYDEAPDLADEQQEDVESMLKYIVDNE